MTNADAINGATSVKVVLSTGRDLSPRSRARPPRALGLTHPGDGRCRRAAPTCRDGSGRVPTACVIERPACQRILHCVGVGWGPRPGDGSGGRSRSLGTPMRANSQVCGPGGDLAFTEHTVPASTTTRCSIGANGRWKFATSVAVAGLAVAVWARRHRRWGGAWGVRPIAWAQLVPRLLRVPVNTQRRTYDGVRLGPARPIAEGSLTC